MTGAGPASSRRPEILVVEDEEAIRETLVECLEGEGYAACGAADGAEALELIGRSGPPDLVLADLVMPVMNGAELLERMRADPATRGVPVVLMTAATPRGKESLPPADAVLAKPLELDAVLGIVARCVRRAG